MKDEALKNAKKSGEAPTAAPPVPHLGDLDAEADVRGGAAGADGPIRLRIELVGDGVDSK